MSRPFWVLARSSAAARFAAAGASAAEERAEEIRERILVAEELVHLLFGHRPVPARAAHIDVPGAALRPPESPNGEPPGPSLALLLRLLVHPPVRAELVVFLALVGIAEHLVRLVDLLELRLGGLVPRIHVGMKLAGELAERLLDLLLRRGLGDAERLVVVLEFHFRCA